MITFQPRASFLLGGISARRVVVPATIDVTSNESRGFQLSSSFPLDLSVSSTSDLLPAPVMWFATYMVASNLLYVARRAALRRQSMRYIWNVRTTRETGVSRTMFGRLLVAWQWLVLLYPMVEPLAWRAGWTVLFYSYPKAQGGGYILEPLHVQDRPANQRTKQQLRLDWHRFRYNIGAVGRNGFRHPPTRLRNLPHLDAPSLGIKHWPWRRRQWNPFSMAATARNVGSDDQGGDDDEKR